MPRFHIRFLRSIDRSELPLLASALTFDAMLAMVPMAILVVGGLGLLLDRTQYFGSTDSSEMIARFFPSVTGEGGKEGALGLVQSLLALILAYRRQFTVFLVPLFIWFSTRLFSSIRYCLSKIFEVSPPPSPHGVVIAYLLGYVEGKLRDLIIVAVVFGLALLSTLLTAGLALLAKSEVDLVAPWTFLVTVLGQVMGQALAIGSAWALFTVLYRYASPKRMAWKGALLAGAVAAVAFELAKYLYGLYVSHMASSQYSLNASVLAVLLVVLWIWYTSLVFLGGAVVAHAWDLGRPHRGPGAVPPLLEETPVATTPGGVVPSS